MFAALNGMLTFAALNSPGSTHNTTTRHTLIPERTFSNKKLRGRLASEAIHLDSFFSMEDDSVSSVSHLWRWPTGPCAGKMKEGDVNSGKQLWWFHTGHPGWWNDASVLPYWLDFFFPQSLSGTVGSRVGFILCSELHWRRTTEQYGLYSHTGARAGAHKRRCLIWSGRAEAFLSHCQSGSSWLYRCRLPHVSVFIPPLSAA